MLLEGIKNNTQKETYILGEELMCHEIKQKNSGWSKILPTLNRDRRGRHPPSVYFFQSRYLENRKSYSPHSHV